jgi:hypothetical protein
LGSADISAQDIDMRSGMANSFPIFYPDFNSLVKNNVEKRCIEFAAQHRLPACTLCT